MLKWNYSFNMTVRMLNVCLNVCACPMTLLCFLPLSKKLQNSINSSSILLLYCPRCDSLNRSTIIYDVPILPNHASHSSLNSSAMINSTRSTSVSDPRSSISSIPSEDPQADLSNSTFSNIGSPVQASSPKPAQQARNRNIKKSLRILNINFQSARKKSKYISTVIETTKPDIILGTETWLSDDIRSSEVFDSNLGFEVHRNDRPSNPHGGVLIAVKS